MAGLCPPVPPPATAGRCPLGGTIAHNLQAPPAIEERGAGGGAPGFGKGRGGGIARRRRTRTRIRIRIRTRTRTSIRIRIRTHNTRQGAA
ncbi:hypothetical protein GCM10009576_052500 [Streptomyces rhizosphaericus]|uniref:Uncharacterized protein n=1 Tax=Streptomyces rhizosphaericus TaxID=114699 RepID=A0ABN1SE41_9ACTN